MMPILDLQDVSKDELIEADLCIVGSGPAGTTIASELANTGLRIVIVESGGMERQSDVDTLNEVESVGWPRVPDQWYVRNRVLGGSSATWGGRCASLDRIDFEARDWVPYSGWPISYDEMTPYLDRSAAHLGLGIGTGFTDEAFWALAKRPKQTPAFDEGVLVPFFWQFSKDARNPFDYMRFAKSLMSLTNRNVRTFLNATVLNVETDASGNATAVEVQGRDNHVRTIRSRCIVLCGGGLENPRMLLASNRVMKTGLGNQNDLVGRFLMDHPRGKVGRFDPATSSTILKWLGVYNVRGDGGYNMYRHGFRLSPEFQRKKGLLNCALFLEEEIASDDPWNALKEILRGRPSLRNGAIIASNAGLFAKGLHQYFIQRNGLPRKLDKLNLTCIVEQRPDPESRLTLSQRTDRLGMPLSHIDWHVNEQEGETVKAAALGLKTEFERLGLVPPVLEDWVVNDGPLPTYFHDHAHPTGATRMSKDRSTGVVNEHCEVFGVSGLFIAGTSVFPTVGHANPTQMIVALSIRLADTLRHRLTNG